jgi:NTP pyrophosphatase (non-canonical NTP hydrolase)
MKSLQELNENVIDWAYEKGIIDKSSPIKQHVKTQEEVTELLEALVDGSEHEIKDAIGDIIVTLIIQAELNDTTINECLQQAYDVISKRTGKMVNGLFVKDE